MGIEQKVIDIIENFRKKVFGDLNDFNSKMNLLSEDTNRLNKEMIEVSQNHDKDFAESHAMLFKKCEYLKAEVWRYKHLLEEFNKIDSTPQMLERLEELRVAFDDYSTTKIDSHISESQIVKSQFQTNFQSYFYINKFIYE